MWQRTILAARGLTQAQAQAIEHCDEARLTARMMRAATAETADEVFARD